MRHVRKHKEAWEKKINLETGLLLIIAIVLVGELLITWNASTVLSDKLRPSNLEFTRLTASSCADCSSLENLVAAIKDSNIKVTADKTVAYNSLEGKQMISKLGIKHVPALVISGEVSRDQTLSDLFVQLGGNVKQGVVYLEANPPYVDTASGEVKGKVKVTNIVDSSCTTCSSLSPLLITFNNLGIKVSEQKNLEYTQAEAKTLIQTFGLEKIPAMIISGDITEYQSVQQIWPQLKATEKSGSFAINALQAPYRNLSTGSVDGLVSLVTLTDSTCATCYNVSLHVPILAGFAIRPASTTTYDVSSSEGKNLLSKYNITKVPTIVISPEASLYSLLTPVWPTVGTVEKDGWYVFRSTNVMGAYKDLSTGQVIAPKTQ